MSQNTDTPDGVNDDGVSLTKVSIADLTRHERRHLIPACEFFVLGYDSSYSNKAESTKRIVGPTHAAESVRGGVRGDVVGFDTVNPDRRIGVTFGDRSGGVVRTSASNGRIGTPLWVQYPADVPDKTTYDVTFRALAGNWSKGSVDPDVDRLTDATVDKFEFDGAVAPPESERRVEDVRVDDGSTRGRDLQRRVAIDIPVRVTVADGVDRDDVVERARNRIDTRYGTQPGKVEYRDDLPPIGDHVVERESPGSRDVNLRADVRYWIEGVDVRVVE